MDETKLFDEDNNSDNYTITIENATLQIIFSPPKSEMSDDIDELYDNVLHWHYYTEIFICTQGLLSLFTPYAELTLKPGDAAVIPIKTPHKRIHADVFSRWRVISFNIISCRKNDGGDIYSQIMKLVSLHEPVTIRGIPLICFSDTINDGLTDGDYYCKALRLADVIMSIYDYYRKNELGASGVKGKGENVDVDRLEQLDQLMNAYYSSNIAVSDIARRMFISERQLSRIAMKLYGISIHRAIIQKRIIAAEQMLRETNYSIDEIISMIGFHSKSAFYREFIKKHNLSPGKYRGYMPCQSRGVCTARHDRAPDHSAE